MRKLLTVFMILFLAACDRPLSEAPAPAETQAPALPEGVTLIERYAGKDGALDISYEKYRLDNGLTVILHQDHSDPLVHVDIAYHVGSAREEPGRSGFAHFFEHMMFEGSENVPPGEFSKIIGNAGGVENGTTNSDRTNYYETLPRNQLETALWLEADRMGLLLQAITQEDFEVQRATVKNERGQRVDNRPYGRVSETMMRNLYPSDHPYSWPVIGWMEDLDAATLNDLKRFFLRWYGPNNATLTIGGNLDPARTLEWVAKYFGPIPTGPEIPKLEKAPGSLDRDRYVTLEDNIHLPAIAMMFPTVYYRHPDEAPLDAATKVLGMGKASLLYQRLVQTGRAVSAHASHACRELACELVFVVVQNPASGESLADMEAAIRETLVEFTERGVNEDDLQKFITGFEAMQVFSLQSVSGKVGNLAFGEVFNEDPKSAIKDIQRYMAVTAEESLRAFRQYIVDRPAVIVSVVPNGRPDLAARPQDFDYRSIAVEPAASGPTFSPPAVEPLPELRSWEDNFDRSVQPQAGANPLVGLPAIEDRTLENGARLLAVMNDETPTVSLRILFAMGQRDEPPGKAGLANLTAALMGETTRRRSAAEFSEALERIGASVSVNAGQYTTAISLNVLSKHFDKGVDLMMERLLEPAFTEEDFERLKSQLMESLLQARKSGPALAGRAMGAVLAGPEHPLSYPGSGLPGTVASIGLEDVRAFYAAHVPQHLQGVLVSSSLPLTATLEGLSPLAALERAEFTRGPVPDQREVSGRTIYLVDKQDAAQSSLRLAHPSLKYDALGDFYRARLMNFNLGGTFESRINLNLREDKGYTYGAGSVFTGGPELGSFRVSTEVNKEATAASISELLGELERFAAAGMTDDEYDFLQNAIGQRDALNYETPGAKLGLLSQILQYDLPLDYRKRQMDLLRETDRKTLNALAARLLDPENIAIVVAGDAAAIRPELDALDMPLVMLDADGLPLTDE